MQYLIFQSVVTVILLFCLYFLSRQTINLLFSFLKFLFRYNRIVFWLVALIFFPGTILHELAHFFAAIILFLRVREIKIFPEWKEDNLKLGHVLYERKDFIRGFLVGIAPVFAGFTFFLLIFYWNIFPGQNIWLNVIFIYLIFTISSTMFSSKQDLKDLIYVPPLLILLGGIIYIFDLKIDLFFRNENIQNTLLSFLSRINFFLLLSLSIHIGIILLLNLFIKRRRF